MAGMFWFPSAKKQSMRSPQKFGHIVTIQSIFHCNIKVFEIGVSDEFGGGRFSPKTTY